MRREKLTNGIAILSHSLCCPCSSMHLHACATNVARHVAPVFKRGSCKLALLTIIAVLAHGDKKNQLLKVHDHGYRVKQRSSSVPCCHCWVAGSFPWHYEKAYKIDARCCTLKSPMCYAAASDITMSSFWSHCMIVAKAHAVLASSCGLSSFTRLSAALAIAAKSLSC